MKKITLLAGVLCTLLLTSCSTDVNDLNNNDTFETKKAKPDGVESITITHEQAKDAAIAFFKVWQRDGRHNDMPVVTKDSFEDIQTLIDDHD